MPQCIKLAPDGSNALHLAIQKKKIAAIEPLILRGVLAFRRDDKGNRPSEYSKNDEQILDALNSGLTKMGEMDTASKATKANMASLGEKYIKALSENRQLTPFNKLEACVNFFYVGQELGRWSQPKNVACVKDDPEIVYARNPKNDMSITELLADYARFKSRKFFLAFKMANRIHPFTGRTLEEERQRLVSSPEPAVQAFDFAFDENKEIVAIAKNYFQKRKAEIFENYYAALKEIGFDVVKDFGFDPIRFEELWKNRTPAQLKLVEILQALAPQFDSGDDAELAKAVAAATQVIAEWERTETEAGKSDETFFAYVTFVRKVFANPQRFKAMTVEDPATQLKNEFAIISP